MVVKYEKLDPITHILKRPDTYIGSVRPQKKREWIATEDFAKIHEQDVTYSDGLLRILIEPLSNTIDNVWRSRQQKIQPRKITIDIEPDGQTRIWNDGIHIPIEVHPTEKIYNPELIFGHLMAGSNMDDSEERLSSGRNGLGIKLSNVFSTHFKVEIYDPVNGLHYSQEWTNNMQERTPPKIRSKKTSSTGFCCVTFTPDFHRFHCEKYDAVMLRLFARFAMDAAMITRIPVTFQKCKFHYKSLQDYVSLYPVVHKEGTEKNEILHLDINPFGYAEPEYHTSVVIASNDTEEYREIGFVNGIFTHEGGVHTSACASELWNHLLPKFSKAGIQTKDLKPHFMIFVSAWVPNPEFSSQSKSRLVSPPIPFQLPPKCVPTIMKWRFVEKINDLIRAKELVTLRKTEKKTRTFKPIEGLDPANLAGTKKSSECTLILCEGLSAKTYATKGIATGWNQKKGRDYFGIYPLRGKLLNVRNASLKSISQNKEITDIIQTLGLKHQTDYTMGDHFDHLRYGRVLIITDADEDGHHICSLILNVFHHLFPSLFARPVPFFYLMMTPIAKIFVAQNVFNYYNDFEYQKALVQWEKEYHGKMRIKYFKGLGTSTDEEIKETFGQKVVSLVKDKDTDFYMDKIFHKNHANDRKEWLTTFDPNAYRTPDDVYPITQYFCQDLIKFSIGDCRRNIPCLYDSLKVSQRKILFSVFKKHLDHASKSIKVAQLAGYCAEVSNYHHGEQCLHDTITRMSQDFPGSNNIAYFVQDGQFGSRSYGGKDAASARYIFTRCTRLTRLLFPVDDDELLTYTLDDGDRVEPDFYVPILPLILINGCVAGIGTGWSSYIPCFNVETIVTVIRAWITDRDDEAVLRAEFVPYYNGFLGTFHKINDTLYECRGVMTRMESKSARKNQNGFVITEIPIGCTTNKYKEELEHMVECKKLKSLKNYSTPNTVHFIVEPGEDFVPTLENMKLVSTISINNLVLFLEDYRLQRFQRIGEILLVFIKKRLDLYETRRTHRLKKLTDALAFHQQKRRFIHDVDQGMIKIFRVDEDRVIEQLKKHSYHAIDGSFKHLLHIPIGDMTRAKIEMLDKKIAGFEDEIRTLRATAAQDLWVRELDVFMQEYHHHHHQTQNR